MMAQPNARLFPLRSESEFIVWCARTVLTDDLTGRIRARAQESLDWSRVLKMAEYHGVVPLLYKNLSTILSDLAPAELLTQLRQKTQAEAMLNRALANELVALCKALTAREIPVIPIKGATLAVSAYGDVALREFTDLDLLVPEGSIAEAQAVLLAQGYKRRAASDKSEEANHEQGPYHVYIKTRGLSRVDLQCVMAHQFFNFRLDRPEFWRSRIPVALENATVPGLAPEMLLIVLCVHGSKHTWELLKWVCDVAELLRSHPELDWNQIFLYASTWRCRGMLSLGLSLAHRLLDAPLPEIVLARLESESDIQLLSHRMPASLLANPQDGINEEQAGALYFSLKDSWRERWSFGLLLCCAHSRLATTPPSWFRWRNSLPRLANLIIPIHRAMKHLLSPTVRGAINRWVAHSG
jgi:hypothetical protein